MEYLETSAKNNLNVRDAFEQLSRSMILRGNALGTQQPRADTVIRPATRSINKSCCSN